MEAKKAGEVAGRLAWKHKKGIAIFVAGAAIATMLTRCSAPQDETPLVAVEQKIVVEPPIIEVKKIEGVIAGCFVKQDMGVDLRAHDERNINIHIPIPFMQGLDPLKGRTIDDNVTPRRINGQTRLCADKDHTNVQATFETITDAATGQQRKIPKHLDVTINAPDLEVVGGIIPEPTSKTSLDPSWLNRITPFVRYDNGNIVGFLDLIGYHLMKDYSCTADALRVADNSLQRTFEWYGETIGNIPKEEVKTRIVRKPEPTQTWPEGRVADNGVFARHVGLEAEALHQLGFGGSVPQDLRLDIGRTTCGAAVQDVEGAYLPALAA